MRATHRGLLIGLLMLITAVAFEAQAVSTAMPAAADDLGQLDLYAWAFTAFMIPQIVAIVLAGRLSDRLGPARPLWGGVVLFSLGIVISASALSMPMLLAGRFVQGFGGGVVNLTLMVVVGRAFPPADLGRVMTWFSAAWMVPSFVGPSASAAIVRALSWHFVFWAVLPIVGVSVLLLVIGFRGVELPGTAGAGPGAQSAEQTVRPVGLGPAVAVALGVAGVQAAGQALNWWSVPLGLGGAALLVWGTPRLMPARWRPTGPGLAAVIGVRALMTGSFFGLIAFLPLMIVQLRQLDLQVAGWVITAASVSWTVGAWFQSRPWLLWSRDAIITAGTVAVLTGELTVTAGSAWPGLPLAVIVVGAMVTGLGMGLGSASTSIALVQLSKEHELGRDTSSLQVSESMGNAILAGIAGTFFAAFAPRGETVTAFASAFGFLSLCAAVSVAASRRIGHLPNLSAARSAE